MEEINKYLSVCNSQLKHFDFPDTFRMCAGKHCNEDSHKGVLDNMYRKIVCILSDAAKSSKTPKDIIRKNRCVKNVKGWNKYVKESHSQARSAFKMWTWFGQPSSGHIFEEMRLTRKIFKGKLKWCIKNQEKIKMDILASLHSKKSFSAFWKGTKKLNYSTPSLPVSVDGKSDYKEIAEVFKDHFRVSSNLECEPMLKDGEGRSEAPVRFTCKEVSLSINSMKRGKSPGKDGLSIEHLQNAGVHLPRVLTLFFNLCLGHSHLPQELLDTVVVPIVKNRTGDIADKGNYRPISLATVIAKVFDSVLDTNLGRYTELHDSQFGFRPGLSTESAIYALKHTVKYYTDRKTPVYACFLDLSRAFDLVSYGVLWGKLREAGIPDSLISILALWYKNQRNFVKWSTALSDPYKLECGVRQGGLTSPRLFNIYVNNLLVELSSTHVGCHVDGINVNNLSYADDMVLLSPSICGVRRLLSICEVYAEKHGLKYNPIKSELLVFRGKNKNPSYVPPVTLSGSLLRRVTKFKYLGHIVTEDLKDDLDMERERRALAVRGNMVARRFAGCSVPVKITLFKAYCQTFYTSSLWANHTQKADNTLRIQYNNAFRVMLRLPPYCSASGMFADAQTDDYFAIMRKKVASLVHRVRGSTNSILKVFADRLDGPALDRFIRLHVLHAT